MDWCERHRHRFREGQCRDEGRARASGKVEKTRYAETGLARIDPIECEPWMIRSARLRSFTSAKVQVQLQKLCTVDRQDVRKQPVGLDGHSTGKTCSHLTLCTELCLCIHPTPTDRLSIDLKLLVTFKALPHCISFDSI